jgi:hypothetical protein
LDNRSVITEISRRETLRVRYRGRERDELKARKSLATIMMPERSETMQKHSKLVATRCAVEEVDLVKDDGMHILKRISAKRQ